MKNWQKQRTMDGAEFVSAIDRLGMTQAGASRYLGFSERRARRAILGESTLTPAEVLLLRSLLHHKDKPEVPVWVSPRTGKPGTK